MSLAQVSLPGPGPDATFGINGLFAQSENQNFAEPTCHLNEFKPPRSPSIAMSRMTRSGRSSRAKAKPFRVSSASATTRSAFSRRISDFRPSRVTGSSSSIIIFFSCIVNERNGEYVIRVNQGAKSILYPLKTFPIKHARCVRYFGAVHEESSERARISSSLILNSAMRWNFPFPKGSFPAESVTHPSLVDKVRAANSPFPEGDW